MLKRELANGLAVSSIGYGAMGLSEFYGNTNDLQSLKLLDQLLELGVDFIDTANFYGRGHNEDLIGYYLSKLQPAQRQQLKVATKCGIDRPAEAAYARSINNTPDYIRKCCDESLQRLGVECIDLFYLHRVDNKIIEQSMDCLGQLVKEGKIAHVGLCEVSSKTLLKAHSVFPVTALQTEYSLWTRDIEQDILETLKTNNIGLVPYSPLGRGFLTGKLTRNSDLPDGDFRKTNDRFLDGNINHNRSLLDIIQPIAQKYQATPGQIALAWLLAQYEHIVPIPGTKKRHYLQENVQASEIILDVADLTTLNDIPLQFEVKGQRYSEEGMKGVNV
ncbi:MULTISPECIES: aldo/keto reductase [Vibrio]|uniref:Aldo/keto reductase n=1 Tax=Vibrio bivalvicida TaxID=1276888 RepID=A0A177Y3P9_9VIBR|nr:MULTISPECIES: aldo/keto reductase [Vibrio]KLN63376.1 aldo/keto reductase [Vibrio sp. VPAP30]OAJ95498.1 aldo/keto reductase [Vibrio bivalvicida]